MTANLMLALQVYGLAILVSLMVAVVIKGIVSTLSAVRAPTEAPVVETPDRDDAIPDEMVGVIAAAAYSVVGSQTIVHIEDRHHGLSWTAEGRAAHHASHTVQHTPRR